MDHSCKNSNDSFTQLTANNQLMGSVQRVDGFLPMGSVQTANSQLMGSVNGVLPIDYLFLNFYSECCWNV